LEIGQTYLQKQSKEETYLSGLWERIEAQFMRIAALEASGSGIIHG